MSHKDKEIEENFSDWPADRIMDDQFVSSFSDSILKKPAYVLTNDNEKTILYSKEQMLEMFRAGFLSMTKESFDKSVFEAKKSKTQCPFRVLKQMKIGSTHIFPYSKWRATRSAASSLRRQFGCVFHVTKVSAYNEIGNIMVRRIK